MDCHLIWVSSCGLTSVDYLAARHIKCWTCSCGCASCVLCLHPGNRGNVRRAAEAGLLVRVSGINQREGERRAENLLCVYRHVQAAKYGVELRLGRHSQQNGRLSRVHKSRVYGLLRAPSVEAELTVKQLWFCCTLRTKCWMSHWTNTLYSGPVGQTRKVERWSVRTIAIFFFYSWTHLRPVISHFCTFLSLT